MSHLLNEQIVHQFIDACTTKKYKKLNDFLSEDITCHIPGRNPLGGNHNGVAALIKLCTRMQHQMESYPLTTTHIHTVSGPTYVASTSLKETAINGRTLTWQAKTLFFFRGELIAACWEFADDQGAFDDYWSQPLSSAKEAIRHSKPGAYPGFANLAFLTADM